MDEESNKQEKRKSVRIQKPLMARYGYSRANGNMLWDQTLVRDISQTGMQITTERPLQPGNIYTFLLKIPLRPYDWIEIKGEVIDSKNLENTYGKSVEVVYITRITFVDMKEEDKKLICDYIAFILSKGGQQK